MISWMTRPDLVAVGEYGNEPKEALVLSYDGFRDLRDMEWAHC